MEHTSTEAHAISTAELTPDALTGGDVLVDVMRAAGVEVAFGVISIHNTPLVEAVDRALRFVPVRHEAAAINAADAYARAGGGIGVAITSTGTGAGNAAGSMLEALTAQSRVLHITGNINVDLIGEGKGAYHEVPRQLAMLKAVSAAALRIETPGQARAVLTDAVRRLATAPFGPVSVDWPIDLQTSPSPTRRTRSTTGRRRCAPASAAICSGPPRSWPRPGVRSSGPAGERAASARRWRRWPNAGAPASSRAPTGAGRCPRIIRCSATSPPTSRSTPSCGTPAHPRQPSARQRDPQLRAAAAHPPPPGRSRRGRPRPQLPHRRRPTGRCRPRGEGAARRVGRTGD